ncbi:MAG TPA: ATP-binding protein [Candidatus Faecalibacterium gallistercoris]|uniref:ATP-binding protein n=1 Tax=Candidatus Faecalibacterium gallistercoris TaxID=2838579 RepID=A0A9D2FHX5_9FIRM|nr:ATP-binding protein [Candidatus Faecalibacterium gallistercoris]
MIPYNADLPSGGISEVHDMDIMHQSDSDVLQCSLFYDPQNGGDAGPVYAQLDVCYLGRSEKIGIDLRKEDYTAQVRRQLRYWNLAGDELMKQVKSHLQEAIIQSISSPKRAYIFCQHGLCRMENDRWVYVLGDTVAGLPEDIEYAILPEVKREHLAWNPAQDVSQAVGELWHIFEMDQRTLLVFSFGILSALYSAVFDMDTTTFPVLAVVGRQGTGKTKIVRELILLYDDAQHPGCIMGQIDAHATSAALAETVKKQRDQAILVDDMAESADASEARERKRNIANILRRVSNKANQGKMTPQKKLDLQFCQAGLVFTGEFMLENPSDITRTIVISTDEPLVHLPPGLRVLAATAFHAFLQWLLPVLDGQLEQLREQLKKLSVQFEPRIAKNGTLLLWATGLFALFVTEQSFLSKDAVTDIVDKTCDALRKILQTQEEQSRKLTASVPKGNLCWYIRDGYSNRQFTIVTQKEYLTNNANNCLMKKGTLYIRAQTLLEYLCNYTPYVYSSVKKMNKTLKEEGVLGDSKEKRSAQIKINGRRYLKLDIKLLQQCAQQYTSA